MPPLSESFDPERVGSGDKGVLSLRDVQMLTFISEGRRPDSPGQLHEDGCLENRSQDVSTKMSALCASLIKTKMVGDEHEQKMVLVSCKIQQARNYKVGIAVGAMEVRMTSMVILDTGAGPNQARK